MSHRPLRRPDVQKRSGEFEPVRSDRVLIVSPHLFVGQNPDCHRARQLLGDPQLARGCVFAAAREPSSLPRSRAGLTRLILVTASKGNLLRLFGVRAMAYRSYWVMCWTGWRAIRRMRPTVVFFSTTSWIWVTLGPIWRWLTGVPFVVDLQDPWVSGYYERNPHVRPPRKHWLTNPIHKRLEAFTLRRAAGLVSVSPAYPAQLAARYDWGQSIPSLVRPFGFRPSEIERAVAGSGSAPFEQSGSHLNGAYVGVLGAVMGRACEALVAALVKSTANEAVASAPIALHFFGTSYDAINPVCTIRPMADSAGVAELVQESPVRLPFDEAIRTLAAADWVLLVGSDNPDYMPSKLFVQASLGKPMLCLFVRGSVAIKYARAMAGVVVVEYDAHQATAAADELLAAFERVCELCAEPTAIARPSLAEFTADRVSRDVLTFCRAVVAHD